MLQQLLLPETVARQNGASAELALDQVCTPLLLTLGITRITEQESLEVSIWGSPDGRCWRELATFPQKFYCGTYSMTVDLTRQPDIRFLRAEWKIGHWGDVGPLFGFFLQVEEVKLQHAAVG
jgi:hypothetical protein